ncbi:MAG: hypothetical protein KAI18_02925 [Candidatus Aenigmarchaeota archaeon]|nr:hypothetical protein [Candidatus Aenigmarchaeota archaeon]
MCDVSSESKIQDYGLNWESILRGTDGSFKKEVYPRTVSELLDSVFVYLDNLTNHCVFDFYIDNNCPNNTISIPNKMEKLTDIIEFVKNYSFDNPKMKYLDTFVKPLMVIKDDINNVVGILSNGNTCTMANAEAEYKQILFNSLGRDIESIKKSLNENISDKQKKKEYRLVPFGLDKLYMDEKYSDKHIFEIQKPFDVLLCLPVTDKGEPLNVDLDTLKKYLLDEQIENLLNIQHLKISTQCTDVYGVKRYDVRLTKGGKGYRDSILTKNASKFDFLVPQDFWHPLSRSSEMLLMLPKSKSVSNRH